MNETQNPKILFLWCVGSWIELRKRFKRWISGYQYISIVVHFELFCYSSLFNSSSYKMKQKKNIYQFTSTETATKEIINSFDFQIIAHDFFYVRFICRLLFWYSRATWLFFSSLLINNNLFRWIFHECWMLMLLSKSMHIYNNEFYYHRVNWIERCSSICWVLTQVNLCINSLPSNRFSSIFCFFLRPKHSN